MRLLSSCLALLGSLILLPIQPAQAAATSFTSSQSFPISFSSFVPCASNGVGEDVAVSGSLHDTFHVTEDAHGGLIVHETDNPQGVTGIGQSTGATYQGAGATVSTLRGFVSLVSTTTNNFLLVGKGNASKLKVKETLHVTINPNDTITASVEIISIGCKT
jgi:hypothetical protein